MLPNQCCVNDPAYIRRISKLAYRYWEARGRPMGSPEDDWFCAEHELASEGERMAFCDSIQPETMDSDPS